jgi:hypothetical protein
MRSRLGPALACALALPGLSCRAALDAGSSAGGTASGGSAAVNAAPGASGATPGPNVAGDASALEPARQLCHVLQGGPAERRAECCGGRPGGHVESSCIRDLSLALGAGRIEIDSAKVESCTLASARALEGCAWVTPGQPVPPAECQGLIVGRVALGGVCRSSLECQGQLHCEGSSPSQAGRCAAPKAPPAACAPAADGLATYLFVRDLEREHPTCAGTCSLLTHRCEAAPPVTGASTAESAQRGRGSKRAGEACQTDFDCSQGGCNGNPGTCGMKCAISLSDQARFKDLSPLSLPSKSDRRNTEAQTPQRSKSTTR